MAKKRTVDDILRKNLGDKLADEVIRDINKMVRAGKSPEKIQREIIANLFTSIQDQVTMAVIAKSGSDKLIIDNLIMMINPTLRKVQGWAR
ncbi:MAG TPA: hypothetical protein VMF59_06515 [Bacteroidota bacterium]|nr:hypothetical protein [Bacteroidota bacterium]